MFKGFFFLRAPTSSCHMSDSLASSESYGGYVWSLWSLWSAWGGIWSVVLFLALMHLYFLIFDMVVLENSLEIQFKVRTYARPSYLGQNYQTHETPSDDTLLTNFSHLNSEGLPLLFKCVFFCGCFAVLLLFLLGGGP